MLTINKRYKDIFEQYIYKGEQTPLTIGSLVVCALCFLLLIVTTFTQINFSHIWFRIVDDIGFQSYSKITVYNPQALAAIFIIYLLGKNYSIFTFLIYLLAGFFVWPSFVFGGGLEYIGNYLFGYLIGFFVAAFTMGQIFKLGQDIKLRLFASFVGVFSIHICGLVYCIILAIFGKLDFSLIGSVFKVLTLSKILYDLLFSAIILAIAPYIKNVFWTCMKPKSDNVKKLKNSRKRH